MTEYRRCTGCARPLEDWSDPLTEGHYIGCVHCARLYLVTEDGLERAFLGLVDPALRWAFEELLEWHWLERIRDVQAAA